LLIAVGVVVSLAGNAQHSEIWKNVLIAIGTSVIATGSAGMLIWGYLSRVETDAGRMNNFSVAGLTWVYDRRAAQIRDEYATRLQAARSHIDIMGFGLKDFRRDYIDDLGALAARAKVRILLLDPDSGYAIQRDQEESQSTGTIAGEIREFVAQFKQKYGSPPEHLEVRLYTCLPLVNIFRIDSDLFWGPYLAGKASGNTLTIRVSQGGTVYGQLVDHFETVWSHYSRALN